MEQVFLKSNESNPLLIAMRTAALSDDNEIAMPISIELRDALSNLRIKILKVLAGKTVVHL